jgi:hypothetical protein
VINWEFTAELFALSSGLALVWPALRLNRNLRKADVQERRAASGRSKWVNKLRRHVAGAYTDPHWNLLEELLTIAGVALLILSSAIKLAVLWHKPNDLGVSFNKPMHSHQQTAPRFN